MTMTEEARETLIAERVEAHDPAKQPTLRLPWRGGSEEFPVVAIEPRRGRPQPLQPPDPCPA